jgi:O-antigen ligase
VTSQMSARQDIDKPDLRVSSALLLVFILMPLTFPRLNLLGFNASGWTWLALLAIVAPIALAEPLRPSAARYALPYLAFLLYAVTTLIWAPALRAGIQTLLQLVVPIAVYLVAWRAPAQTWLRQRMVVISRLVLAIAIVLVAGWAILGEVFVFGPVSRPASMSLVLLFVVATMNSKSWRYTVLMAGLVLILLTTAGARTASAVLVVVLLLSPSLGVRWRTRIVLAMACALLLIAGSQTTAFKQRFFFNEREASLADVVTLSGNLNTAGRRELWPELEKVCSQRAMTGWGIGSASVISGEISGLLPHNEYLRTYCDVGMLGGVPFWAFYVWAAYRSWRGALTRPQRLLHGAAGQLTVALLLFAVTDNSLSFTALFMAPLMVVLGLSDRELHSHEDGTGRVPPPV